MIIVTIDLHSAVDHKKYLLDTVYISNDGKGSDLWADYNVSLLPNHEHLAKTGRVIDFRRCLGAMELVRLALESIK